jgi:hypothetical protein
LSNTTLVHAACLNPCPQVRGVATRGRDVSLLLQLTELGCMSLMPVDQLLPSQLAELLGDAGMPLTEGTYLTLYTLHGPGVDRSTTEALQVC